MHEILTIQCGDTASYIGTHFWNFQDPTDEEALKDNDHDVLFGSGQARNGMETYTPRLLIYDRAKNFGSMKRINALYEEPETPMEDLTVVQGEVYTDHPFQKSLESETVPDGSLLCDANVRFWSDYNTQFYRPQSYLPIDSTVNTNAFDQYELGRSAYTARNRDLDVLDSDVRPFLEECDLPQGFNIIADLHDAWAGWTTEMVQELASEFPKTPKFIYSSVHPTQRGQCHALGSTLLAVHDDIDAFLPLDCTPSWSKSASAALWIDSITLPMRSRRNALGFADVTSFMTPQHKLFSPRMHGVESSPIGGRADRRFRVVRDCGNSGLESQLMHGVLVSTYQHASKVVYPTSFPEFLQQSQVSASMDDCPTGSLTYLHKIRDMVAGIRGAHGYVERKEMCEEMTELEGVYQSELFNDEQDSSDDDGF